MSKEAEKFIEKYTTKDQNDWLVKKKDIIAKFMESYHNEQLRIAIVSKSIAKQYAEFCIRCDREGLPLLELDDYIKQYSC